MEDFYKEFKDRVEGRPDPEFRPDDWADMEARLDKDSAGVAPFPWLWWTLPIAILGLIGWNVYLHYELSTNKVETPVAQTLTDTVIIEKIVYKTDTVYQEKIEYVTLPPEVIERIVYMRADLATDDHTDITLNAQGIKPAYADRGGSGTVSEESQNNIGLTTSAIKPSSGATEIGSFPQGSISILKPVPSLTMKAITSHPGQGKIARFQHTPFLDLEKLTRKKHAQPDIFRPRALSVELGTGFASPFNTDLDHIFGYTLVAGAKLRFDPGYRIWADVSLQNMEFKSSLMGDDIGVPVVIPPSDQFDFENANVPRRSVQYSVGMDYVFYPNKILRPVLGVGVAGVEYFHTEIIYDFVNRNTGAEFIFEKNSDDEHLRVNYALFKFGVEYSLTRRYSLGFMGFYRKGLDDGFGINDLIEGRLSISARIF